MCSCNMCTASASCRGVFAVFIVCTHRYMIIQPLPLDAVNALYPGRKYLFGAVAALHACHKRNAGTGREHGAQALHRCVLAVHSNLALHVLQIWAQASIPVGVSHGS
jgi:hypothetical protein